MKDSLRRRIEELEKNYDEKECLLYYDHVFNEYHSKWQGGAHTTNDSLAYANVLLQADPKSKRADDIIRKVLTLQDLDTESPTYGSWQWYLEERLDEMETPDLNWAYFCSLKLLRAVLSGYDKEVVREAVFAACKCIIKRNISPSYMNICVMGCAVTLIAGQIYGFEEAFDFGKNRLRTFYESNEYSEYNSPRYTGILLQLLSDIEHISEDREVKTMAAELCDRVWGMIANHFHPETLQWTGPMTRTYSTMTERIVLANIMGTVFGEDNPYATGMTAFGKSAWHPCPEKYRHFFDKTTEPREINYNYEDDKVAHAYITDKYALGSFEKSDMWKQRRPLVAFWGKRGDVKYFNVRSMHDGYEFCAATLEAKQDKGRVEAKITFDKDGGDRHIDLDLIKNGKIKAKDLRIIFEFYNTEPVYLKITKAMFDGKTINPERTENGIELPLYNGEERVIDFNSVKESEIKFIFDISELK